MTAILVPPTRYHIRADLHITTPYAQTVRRIDASNVELPMASIRRPDGKLDRKGIRLAAECVIRVMESTYHILSNYPLGSHARYTILCVKNVMGEEYLIGKPKDFLPYTPKEVINKRLIDEAYLR